MFVNPGCLFFCNYFEIFWHKVWFLDEGCVQFLCGTHCDHHLWPTLFRMCATLLIFRLLSLMISFREWLLFMAYLLCLAKAKMSDMIEQKAKARHSFLISVCEVHKHGVPFSSRKCNCVCISHTRKLNRNCVCISHTQNMYHYQLAMQDWLSKHMSMVWQSCPTSTHTPFRFCGQTCICLDRVCQHFMTGIRHRCMSFPYIRNMFYRTL